MRTDGRSSLDFMYWILENVEENYQAVGTDDVFVAAADGSLMHSVIVDCAQVCGVEVPRTLSALLALVERYDSGIDPSEALSTRGAILRHGSDLVVSMGDERRLVGIDSGGSVSLYRMGTVDRDPAYWDSAFLLPEMRYL